FSCHCSPQNSLFKFALFRCCWLSSSLLNQVERLIITKYFIYVWIVNLQLLTNSVQVTFYLVVFHFLCVMLLWSLGQSIITPTARVPSIYFADEETDKKLKEITPCKDGRYLPDASSPEQTQKQLKILEGFAASKGLKFLEVDNYNRLRYCYLCGLIKPDRTHHCMSCGACVVKYDHHCPWINKCVSYNNYKFFVLYLLYSCVLIAWCILTSTECIIRYFLKQRWIEGLPNFCFVALAVILCAIFAYYPLGQLLIYHVKLASLNETTCEQAKPPNIRGDVKADYNMGTYRNLRAAFGWGLWLFPVSTHVNDGLHFPVRYTEASNGIKYCTINVKESTE
ncbi:Palmitoyltransferase ZDHHC15, partial [Toxocara canis]